MSSAQRKTEYVLGASEFEHGRLTRQAKLFGCYTERLLRDAGVGPGQRVLDVGCGVGDVALLAASLVGETGHVVGIDRDTTALDIARSRAAAIHVGNIQFLERGLPTDHFGAEFDAIVGRFVLMFQPDPKATIDCLTAHLRPGGVIVFQEGSWATALALAGQLPLRTACGDLISQTFRCSGARPDMPLVLYQALLDCGYQAPNLRVEVPVVVGADAHHWLSELMESLLPRCQEMGLAIDGIGDIATLCARLELEQRSTRSYAPLVGIVGAWARKSGAPSC